MPIGPARALALAYVGALPITLPVVGRPDAVDRRRTRDRRRLRGIEYHDRPLAFVRLLDRVPQQFAVGDDRLVGRAEMLTCAVLDRAHGFTGPLVVHGHVGAPSGIG